MQAIDTRGNLNINKTYALSQEMLIHTCKMVEDAKKEIEGEKTCRYIMYMPAIGFFCAKHTQFKDMLDGRVLQNRIIAKGDNCEGLYEQKETKEKSQE